MRLVFSAPPSLKRLALSIPAPYNGADISKRIVLAMRCILPRVARRAWRIRFAVMTSFWGT
jgi:hypothetical protein